MEQPTTLPPSMEASDVPFWTLGYEEECIKPAVNRLWSAYNRGAFAGRDTLSSGGADEDGGEAASVQSASFSSPPFDGILDPPSDPDPPTIQRMLGTLNRLEDGIARNVEITKSMMEKSMKLLHHVHDTAKFDIYSLRSIITRYAARSAEPPVQPKSPQSTQRLESVASNGSSQRAGKSTPELGNSFSTATVDGSADSLKVQPQPHIVDSPSAAEPTGLVRSSNMGTAEENIYREGQREATSSNGVGHASELDNNVEGRTDNTGQQHNVAMDTRCSQGLGYIQAKRRRKASTPDIPTDIQSARAPTSEGHGGTITPSAKLGVDSITSPRPTTSFAANGSKESTSSLLKPPGAENGGEGQASLPPPPQSHSDGRVADNVQPDGLPTTQIPGLVGPPSHKHEHLASNVHPPSEDMNGTTQTPPTKIESLDHAIHSFANGVNGPLGSGSGGMKRKAVDIGGHGDKRTRQRVGDSNRG